MDLEQVNKIMYQMTDVLDNAQMMHLKKVLEDLSRDDSTEDDSLELVERFIATKQLEGRSERTLKYYRNTIDKMMVGINKNIRAITTDDLRQYLADYQLNSNASKMSIDNIRRNLSSFFNWLEDENYILKSPVKRIHKIKAVKSVKEAYSDDEMEQIRDCCSEIRDLALIDMLASTGMRIGELVRLKMDALATWQFANEMKVGDVIYVKKGLHQLVGKGIVTSDYYYDDSVEDEYRNIRNVEWICKGSWPHPGNAVQKTLTNITPYTDYVEKLNALFATEEDYEAEDIEKEYPTYSREDDFQIAIKKQRSDIGITTKKIED